MRIEIILPVARIAWAHFEILCGEERSSGKKQEILVRDWFDYLICPEHKPTFKEKLLFERQTYPLSHTGNENRFHYSQYISTESIFDFIFYEKISPIPTNWNRAKS